MRAPRCNASAAYARKGGHVHESLHPKTLSASVKKTNHVIGKDHNAILPPTFRMGKDQDKIAWIWIEASHACMSCLDVPGAFIEKDAQGCDRGWVGPSSPWGACLG